MDQILKRPDISMDRFDEDPEVSYTMPASMYFDPEVLKQEKKKIFGKHWCLAAHASDLSTPGSFVACEITGQHIAVVRSKAGELSAFFNVCQHRGHLLLKGKGQIKNVITCPYHAWAYDHSGHLVSAPNCEAVRDFDKADFTIPPVHVEEFFGFVFVNLDPAARPMREVYPGLDAELAKHFSETESFHPQREILFDIKGNWKNVGDNALECYHCHGQHKDFVNMVDMETYKVECFENWSMQYGDCRPSNSAYNYEGAEDCGGVFIVFYIFPDLFFAKFAGTDGLVTFSFRPTAPEVTRQQLIYYGRHDVMAPAETGAMDYFNNVLGPEDVGLVECVQQGLHSEGYHQGRFIIDRSRGATGEHAVHHFHSLVMDALG